jgi:hypothetical protein
MAQTIYLSDANLTDRLPSDLTSTDISSSALRLSICITPACAWVDSVYPGKAPFTATPNTETLVKMACLEFAIYMAHSVMAQIKQADASLARAKSLLMVDESTGTAQAAFEVGGQSRIKVFDLARSLYAEDRDTDADELALYP